MAYLHCHNCNWSQDDFWNFKFSKYGYFQFPLINKGWSYNPISCFLSYVFGYKGYWFPRRIEHDKYCAEENGWKRSDPHSWWLTWYQFIRMLKKFRHMAWWTEEAFRKDRKAGIAKCPNCGSKDQFDID